MDTLTFSMNTMWVLLTGFLVFFMQAGFALVETGFTRAKNVSHTMMMNMMVFCIGAIGYFICGFAFQFGGVGDVATLNGSAWGLNQMFAPGGWGLIGLKGFFLSGLGGNLAYLAFFLFQMVFMDTAATIPTGAMAERLKFSGFVVMSLWVSMIIYPIFGNWVWGGGWLSGLGRTLGLGHGAVDFAGSSVVHMVGGMVGLAGALVLGARIGKYNKDGSSNTIPGHNIPMAILGTIILFFGWFGFNPGSTLSGVDSQISMVAVNTLLAGAMGGITAMTYMWLVSPLRKPEPGNSVNGILAGLVAVTAPCAFIDPWAAVLIGGFAGVLVCLAAAFFEKRGVDDPVGAVSVHGVNGAWGILSLGLFANGSYGDGWNGVSGAVRGLFYGDGGQLLAQSIVVVVNIVFVFGLSYLFFKLLDRVMGLRSRPADEINGLDVPEMGSPGYVDDEVVKQPGALPRGKVPEFGAVPVTGK